MLTIRFLAELTKWPTEPVQVGCGVIVAVGIIIIIIWCHLCAAILVTSFMGATSYVAYILVYKCMLNNLGM